ncbi:unnamed protein product [Haemonchus placei]|uniref:HEPN_Swt1 domain-containing protein n=1 Tax=Haemonchus placei TaxID=6290 RepID=A0A0N4WGM5_HAEPC|nr:unnamed protein product [Haemonchus placei]
MCPRSYEEGHNKIWHTVKNVRNIYAHVDPRTTAAAWMGVVEVLAGLARGFKATIFDAYETIDTEKPQRYPAMSLGSNPSRSDERFHPRLCARFLNQVRKVAFISLLLPSLSNQDSQMRCYDIKETSVVRLEAQLSKERVV